MVPGFSIPKFSTSLVELGTCELWNSGTLELWNAETVQAIQLEAV